MLDILTRVLNSAEVALGFGFVIFIHELGHFLLAKWNGVKIEKFSIGFGPTLLGFKRGETEYVLAAIPLGGFVKMLGEGPDEEGTKSTDPRAYSNKSVGARMAIISAGVTMNVLLALGCFVYAYGHGMDEQPPIVGNVVAGTPAYDAGVRAGDEIVSIDGRGDLTFNSMMLKVLLSGSGQSLRFQIRRPGQAELLGKDIQPRREPGSDRPTIGVLWSYGLNVRTFAAPAGMKSAPSFPKPLLVEGQRAVDTLVAVGRAGEAQTPVEDIFQYIRRLAADPDKALTHVIERRLGPLDAPGKLIDRFEITLPPANFVDLGLRFACEPITGVQKGAPADLAGFQKGDRIVKVNGADDFDPMRLPSIVYENAGKPMTFEVARGDGGKATTTLRVTPDESAPWAEPTPNEALELPGLGLCYPVTTHVVAVKPGSPAARAGLKAGDVVNSMTVRVPAPPAPDSDNDKSSEPAAPSVESFQFDDSASGWVRAFWVLQSGDGSPISLVVNKASKPVELTPEIDPTWYLPERGLEFVALFRKLPPQSISSAIRRGWDDTLENIVNIYAMFRSLGAGRVGPKGLAGPLRIAQVAYDFARGGLSDLIHFLGILSINLAVINFLPIPPLDGGQMLFLAAEKVRGKPLPDSALSAGILIGVFLVICLMVFVTYQDISWYIENWSRL